MNTTAIASDPASKGLDIKKEVADLKGRSWYDAEDEYRRVTGRQSLTRIVFVALLDLSLKSDQSTKNGQSTDDEKDESDQISDLEMFFKETIMDCSSEEENNITGGIVFVGDPGEDITAEKDYSALLGFLETSSPPQAYMVLRKIGKSDMIHSTRIILATDDCPSHEFGEFGVYRANPKSEEEVDLEAEGPVNVVSNIMTALCKVTLSLPDVARGCNVMVPKLSGPQRKAIPSANRVASCAKSDIFATTKEFLEMFDSPIYLELHSEKVSPIPTAIDNEMLSRTFLQQNK